MLALAIIQAGDQTLSPRFVLLVTIGAVFAGGLIGAMVATTVMTRRGIPVRRPRSTARFVAIFGITLLLWLILSLLAPSARTALAISRRGTLAIFPLLGLLATELVDGITLRSATSPGSAPRLTDRQGRRATGALPYPPICTPRGRRAGVALGPNRTRCTNELGSCAGFRADCYHLVVGSNPTAGASFPGTKQPRLADRRGSCSGGRTPQPPREP